MKHLELIYSDSNDRISVSVRLNGEKTNKVLAERDLGIKIPPYYLQALELKGLLNAKGISFSCFKS